MPCPLARLLRLDAGGLDDRPPLLDLGLLERREPRRRLLLARGDIDAKLEELGLHGRIGQDIWPRDKQTPEALAAHQQSEIEKWWPIIKAAGIKGQ